VHSLGAGLEPLWAKSIILCNLLTHAYTKSSMLKIDQAGFTHRAEYNSHPPDYPAAVDVAPVQRPYSSADAHMCVSIVDAQLMGLISHQQQRVGAALSKVGQGRSKGEGCRARPCCDSRWASQGVQQPEAQASGC